MTINSLGRLSQHKICFPSALTYAMALLTLVLHEVQLWGWWAGAPQALTQFELLCPRALLGADYGDLQSRGRAAAVTHFAWTLPIYRGVPCKNIHPSSHIQRKAPQGSWAAAYVQGAESQLFPSCCWIPPEGISHTSFDKTLSKRWLHTWVEELAGSSLQAQGSSSVSTTAAASLPIIPNECCHSSSQNLLGTPYLCFLTLFTQDKPACLGPLLSTQHPQGAGEHPQAVVHLVPCMGPSKSSSGFVEGLLFGVKRIYLALGMGQTVPWSPALCRCSETQGVVNAASPQTLTCCPCCSQLRTHWLSSSKPWVQLYMPSKTGGGGLQTTGTQCPSSHCPLSRHWTFRNFLRKHRHQTGLQSPRHCTLGCTKHPRDVRSRLQASLLDHHHAPHV